MKTANKQVCWKIFFLIGLGCCSWLFARNQQVAETALISMKPFGCETYEITRKTASAQAGNQRYQIDVYKRQVITYAGPLIATLMTGSFVIESLFSVAGIGAEYVTSISNRDYTMIMGLTIFFGAFIIIANIITDILNAVVDPRINLDS